MKTGIGVIFFSAIWVFFLLTRIMTVVGKRFVMLSGDNIFDANGFALSNYSFFFFWSIAIGGFCFGIWLILSDIVTKGKTKDDSMSNGAIKLNNIGIIGTLLITIVIIFFAEQNSAEVMLSFFTLHFVRSLAFVLVVVFAFGILAGILADMFVTSLRPGKKLARRDKEDR